MTASQDATDRRPSTAHDAQAAPPHTVYRVLVASRSFGKNSPAALEAMRAAGCVFLPPFERLPGEEEVLARIGEADVLISGTEPVTARVLAAATRLKVISKHGVGYENIDLAAARARGVVVAIASGTVADSVADMTMALLLALARDVVGGVQAVRAGAWPRVVGMELRDKTLGIVGMGAIGKAVCQRAVAFGMRVVAHDVREDAAFATAHDVAYVSLDEVLRRADVLTLHAPVLPETRHLVDAARLALMKPSALLINTARGELVDEQALADALRAGRLAGAALDVFTTEPPEPDNPLIGLDNVLATPHSASQTEDGLRHMGDVTAENALRVLRGEEPLYRIA